MTMKQATADPRKRHRTRYPGVYYRIGRDGRRAYLIGFRDERGRQVWKRVPGDLEAAKDALAEIRRKMGAGEPVRPQARTFADLAEEWEAIYLAKLRPSTAATYRGSLRRYVQPAFGDVPVQLIDARAVAKWVGDLQARGLKAWTIRAALTPLRRILTYAVRERLIPENPVARLGRDELPASDAAERRVFSADELRRLLDAATRGAGSRCACSPSPACAQASCSASSGPTWTPLRARYA
jgi:hypothetical protein